jgi:hypothetical protein
LGHVGTDWTFVTLGSFNGSDTTDLLLRSASTGAFEVYDIANNNITGNAFLGTVGMDWQVMGFGNFLSLRRCRFNVRFARKRTRLKGAQHLVL